MRLDANLELREPERGQGRAMKPAKASLSALLRPTNKKIELKAPIKVTKVCSPRLAANHNETLLINVSTTIRADHEPTNMDLRD
jgi:hypothetical protein